MHVVNVRRVLLGAALCVLATPGRAQFMPIDESRPATASLPARVTSANTAPKGGRQAGTYGDEGHTWKFVIAVLVLIALSGSL